MTVWLPEFKIEDDEPLGLDIGQVGGYNGDGGDGDSQVKHKLGAL